MKCYTFHRFHSHTYTSTMRGEQEKGIVAAAAAAAIEERKTLRSKNYISTREMDRFYPPLDFQLNKLTGCFCDVFHLFELPAMANGLIFSILILKKRIIFYFACLYIMTN